MTDEGRRRDPSSTIGINRVGVAAAWEFAKSIEDY